MKYGCQVGTAGVHHKNHGTMELERQQKKKVYCGEKRNSLLMTERDGEKDIQEEDRFNPNRLISSNMKGIPVSVTK